MRNNDLEMLARQCHEANRGYCRALGDDSQKSWDEAEQWQRDSAIAGVKAVLENPAITPEDLHGNWMAHKIRNGWVYGEIKDAEKKTHPCMVAYDRLPVEQRAKDSIFRGIINGYIDHEIHAEDSETPADEQPAVL